METNQDKNKRNFKMGFLKSLCMYMFIAVAVFFGYIQVFGDVEPIIVGLDPDSGYADTDNSALSDLITIFTDMDNCALDFHVCVEGSETEIYENTTIDTASNFYINGTLNLNFEEGADIKVLLDFVDSDEILLNLDFRYNNQKILVGINDVYYTLNFNEVKCQISDIDLSSTFDKFELSDILCLISQNEDITKTFVEIISKANDIIYDLTEIDFLEILTSEDPMSELVNIATKLQFSDPEEILDEDGEVLEKKYVIKLGKVNITIIADKDLNLKSLHLDEIECEGYRINLYTSEKSGDFEVIAKEEIQNLNYVLDVVKAMYDLTLKQALTCDISVDLDDSTYAVILKSDVEAGKIEIDFVDYPISLYYDGDSVYLTIYDYKLKIEPSVLINRFDEVLEFIESNFEINLQDEIVNLVNDLVQKIKDELTNCDIRGIIKNITNYLPATITRDNNLTNLTWENKNYISFEIDQMLESISLEIDEFKLYVKISDEVEITEIDTCQYYNLSKLFGLLPIISEILTQDKIEGKIDLSYNDMDLTFNYVIDFSEVLKVSLSTNYFGMNMQFIYENDILYVCLGDNDDNVKIKTNLSISDLELGSELDDILNYLDLPSLENTSIVMYLINNIALLENPDNIINLKAGNIVANMSLLNGSITMDISNEDIKASVTIAPSEEEILVTEEDYEDIAELLDVINLISNADISANMLLKYEGYEISAIVNMSADKKIIEISNITITGLNIDLSALNICLRIELANEAAQIYDARLYLQIGEMRITEKISNFDDIIEDIKNIIEQLTGLSLEDSSSQLSSLVSQIQEFTLSDLESIKLSIAGNLKDLTIKVDNIFEYENLLQLNLTQDTNGTFCLGLAYDELNLKLWNIIESTQLSYLDYTDIENYNQSIMDIVSVAKTLTTIYQEMTTDYGYAFESDIAIRYSTISFFGKISVALVTRETGIVPYVALTTSALGLSSKIYLLDDILYLDVQGLTIEVGDATEDMASVIEEILLFVSENFNVEISTESLQSMQLILPQLKDLYLQISSYSNTSLLSLSTLNDAKIIYSVDEFGNGTSYFYDILCQIQFSLNNIEQIVLGLNIKDPNTTKMYESYLNYALEGIEDEESLTIDKNFALYLYNISLDNADLISSLQFENYQTLEGLIAIANGESVNLSNLSSSISSDKFISESDYVSYKSLLNGVSSVIDYGTEGKFDLSADITITDSKGNEVLTTDTLRLVFQVDTKALANAFSTTETGNDVLTNVIDGVPAKFYGEINLIINDVAYDIDALYDNQTCYVNYAHGSYIGSDDFKVKFEKANLKELIALVFELFDINLSEEITQTLALPEINTDLTLLKSLIFGESEEISSPKIDQTLISVENILSKIQSINLREDSDNLTLDVDLVLNNETAKISLVISKTSGPVSIKVSNLKIGDNILNGAILFNENSTDVFDERGFVNATGEDVNIFDTYQDSINEDDYMNFSSITDFVQSVSNSLNQRSVSLQGALSLLLNIGSIDVTKVNMDTEIDFSLDENNNVDLQVQFNIHDGKLVTYASYVTGDLIGYTYTVALNGTGGDLKSGEFYERVSTLHMYYDYEQKGYKIDINNTTHYKYVAYSWTGYKADVYADEAHYSSDSSLTDGTYKKGVTYYEPKVISDSYYVSDLKGDTAIEMIVKLLGLTDVVHKAIKSAAKNSTPSISLETTIENYYKTNVTNSDNGYYLQILGDDLTGSNLGSLCLTFGDKKYKTSNNKELNFLNYIGFTANIMEIVNVDMNLSSNAQNETYIQNYLNTV